MTVRVVRNDWSTIAVPELGRWRPELTVSVVIPAYRCQASLEVVLAALAHQTYPTDLLEVVVVDDNSDPPLRLPSLRPARCRITRPPSGWGRANALHHGAAQATGQILHWLDADMLVYPEHVEAQARWHHRLPYAVTLGWKRFVDVAPGHQRWPTPEQVVAAARGGNTAGLFAGLPSTGHDYVEQQIARTRQLRDADETGFLTHVGATAALRRELYEATGGLDTRLRLGEDTEFGYRLAQAGAVFIPEPRARSWHLGPTHMMRHQVALQRYNRPFLADRMPQPRWLRRRGGTGWAVPLATVVTDATEQPLERVRAAVDSVLAGDEPDLQVMLVGPWHTVSEQRRSPLADPALELRLIAATYRSEPRVRLVERAPATAYPAPFRLELPAGYGLAPPALRRLVEYADRHRLGLVRVPPASQEGTLPQIRAGRRAPSSAPSRGEVRLWRTAAVHRAGWAAPDGVPVTPGEVPVVPDGARLAWVVAQVWGAGQVSAHRVGVVDLTSCAPAELAAGRGFAQAATDRWLPSVVEVAGVRSLARAAWVVARLTGIRLAHRLRHR